MNIIKRYLIAFFLIFVVSAFGGLYSSTVNYLATVVDKCIANSIFHEELVSIRNEDTWADGVFLPAISLKGNITVSEDTLGFLVLKFRKQANEPVKLTFNVNVSGTSLDGKSLSNKSPTVWLITDSYQVLLEPPSSFLFEEKRKVITSSEYLILAINDEEVDRTKTMFISLETETPQALWRIQPDSDQMTKFKNIVNKPE